MPAAAPQIVVFGATGDLARKKLLPALARLCERGEPKGGFQVIGVARRPLGEERFRELAREAGAGELEQRLFYEPCDVERDEDLERLHRRLDELAGDRPVGRLFYLALAPELFAPTVERLAQSGLLERRPLNGPDWRRLVVEKPFGTDLRSGRALNAELHAALEEHQIYRIDHYLGKETVQNLLGFRFHNAIFEPLWNRDHVELVQITVAEDIGVEHGRAAFYEETGALRDVMQNHVLQVLAMIAMEPPSCLEAEEIRGRKVQVLRAVQAPDLVDAPRRVVRGRYGPGEVDGRSVAGYLEEEGVAPDSTTETYVAVRATIGTWRWEGVPFLLRHGKRLGARRTEVRIQFRTPPLQLFDRPKGVSPAEHRRMLAAGQLCHIRPNVLTLGIQPREDIRLGFGVKQPGPEMVMSPAEMAFDYRERFHERRADAYERLLLDALQGDPTLFLRADEIEASWTFADEVRAGWEQADVPLREYAAGSWGPPEADQLFQGCEGSWPRG